MFDEELEDLVRERLFQAVLTFAGLLVACALLGGSLWAVVPTLRALPKAATTAAARLPDVVRIAARTARDTATTTAAAAKDGWRSSGEK